MKKIIIFAAIVTFTFSCEKNTDKINAKYTARIAGFDLNCSTCILEFPDDSLEIKGEIGKSPNNQYQAINLSKEDFKIGQLLKVKIRKAESNELRACITLYVSNNLKNVFIMDFENFDNLIFNDTVKLFYRDCLSDSANQMYLCLDTVLTDSRCPTGVQCIWEGNASVRFKFEKNNEMPVFFNLNTNRRFTSDTIIDNYKFTLTGLSPYPSMGHPIMQKDYKAELIIKKMTIGNHEYNIQNRLKINEFICMIPDSHNKKI